MPAYVISDVRMKDASAMALYRERAAASIAQYGGRYVLRLGQIETLEGAWTPERVVIVEFPDVQAARAWYSSPEYAQALAVRDRALTRNLILIDSTEH
jgi:uncharacterized protein (DUF1330 family)